MRINPSVVTVKGTQLKANEIKSVQDSKTENKLLLNKVNFALAESMKANLLFKGYKSESAFLLNEIRDSLKLDGTVTLSGYSSINNIEAKNIMLRNDSEAHNIKAENIVELESSSQVTGEIIFTKDKGKVILDQGDDGKYPYVDPSKVKNGEIVVRRFIKGYDYDDLWEHFDQLGDSYGDEEPFNPEIHKIREQSP